MKHVLLVSPFRPGDIDRFTDIEGYEFVYAPQPSDEQLLWADVLIGNPKIDWVRKAKNTSWVQLTFAGSDAMTKYPDAFEHIMLTNLSGAFGQSISEFVLTMVLMLYKHLHLYRDHQRECLWTDEGYQDTPVGKKLLILGAGNIGTDTARLFRIFNCEIIGMCRTHRTLPDCFDRCITMEELDSELPTADIVISALPESPATHKLISAERLKLFKKTALLLNVGRGALIDSMALCDALNSGSIAGAAIDVTDPEPLPADHPLWQCKNLILTPHITGGSFGHLRATEERLFEICRENLIRRRDGQPLLNRVDMATGYRVMEDRAD